MYWCCLKKFAREAIDIDNHCVICYEQIELQKLWDHVAICWTNEERKWYNNTKIECSLCETSISLNNYGTHLEQCKNIVCDNCGETIKKVDEATHKRKCEGEIIELDNCHFCDEMIEVRHLIYSRHVRQCKQMSKQISAQSSINSQCKICGEQNDLQHDCTRCPICMISKPVANWRILDCGHYICDCCSTSFLQSEYERLNDVISSPAIAQYTVCREEIAPYEGKKIFL